MEPKKDFNPPAWLVVIFPEIKLDEERAKRFHNRRVRLCAHLGKEKEECHYNALFNKAIDLLLENEAALLTKIEYE